jgi:hypothetical protein
MRKWAFAAVVIAGCGWNSTFEPGDRATLGDNPWNKGFLVRNLGGAHTRVEVVPAGTHVKIVHDPGPPSIAGRGIRVEFLDGPFQGLQGDVQRNQLRPD